MTNKQKVLFAVSIILFAAILFGTVTTTQVNAPKALATNSPDEWLRISGADILYHGQPIKLRGTNFNNGPALGGNTWLANGDITKIPETRADYQKLREMGANHVRFGLDYQWYSKDKAAFFAVMDNHVAWSKEAGIWFLPVMFILPGNCYEGYSAVCPFWDNATYKQQLKDFWVDFITRYANEPTVIGIDVLNEPNVGASQNWSAKYFWTYAQTVRDAVVSARLAINPNSSTLVFIEAGSSPNSFINLGANVVYEEHMYMPSGITHGSKSNTPFTCTTGAVYPGASSDWGFSGTPLWDKSILGGTGNQSILKRFSVNWAKTNNVPYYVGEWSARSGCAGWDAYVKDVADILNSNGVHYAHFNWRARYGNFDIYPSTGVLPATPQNQKTYDIMLCAWKDNYQMVAGNRASLPADCSGASVPTNTAAPLPNTITPTYTNVPVITNTPAAGLPPMTFLWGDEFDGASVDTTKWNIANDTRADDTNKTFYRPENVSINNGILKLTINNVPITANNYLGQSKTANYTGGMLEAISSTSTDSKKFRLEQYGYFEARIKYRMIGCGYWSNFWLYGRPTGPDEFDLEIMSCTGSAGTTSRANQIRPAYHYKTLAGVSTEDYKYSTLAYNDTWHIYGILWQPNQPIKYFIDGVEIYTPSAVAIANDIRTGSPTTQMYVTLRAGAYRAKETGGLPTASTLWPGSAEYDWVRVYTLGGSTSPTNTPVATIPPTVTFSPVPSFTFTPIPTLTATPTKTVTAIPPTATPSRTATATTVPTSTAVCVPALNVWVCDKQP